MRALCLFLILALFTAPAVEAAHHGPGTLTTEADHHGLGYGHDHAGSHQDASDHDHVSIAALTEDGTGPHPEPDRQVHPGPDVPSGCPLDGPRRPPRPMMI